VVHDRLLNLLAAERRGVRRLGLGAASVALVVLCVTDESEYGKTKGARVRT